MLRFRSVLVLMALWSCAAGAASEAAHHTFWVLKGHHNTVYFLGSVHMLKPDQSALPPEALAAYADVKALVMEIDLNDLSVDPSAIADSSLTTLPEGQTLRATIGASLYDKLQTRARTLGMDTSLLDSLQPWFAGMLLEQLSLTSEGLDASAGVDMQLAQRAAADDKPIIGLETLADQLGIFAHLPLAQQRDFLQSTLDDADSAQAQTNDVIQAWQRGDTARLEQLLRDDSRESPQLYQALTTDRNHKWLPKIDALLDDNSNYLVVVGALHLVGHDGLIELLRQQGYMPVQH